MSHRSPPPTCGATPVLSGLHHIYERAA